MTANNEWPCWNVRHMAAGNHDDGMTCGPICHPCTEDAGGEGILVCSVCKQERFFFYNSDFNQETDMCCEGGHIEQGVQWLEQYCKLRALNTANGRRQYRLFCDSCGNDLERINSKTGNPSIWSIKHGEVQAAKELFDAAYANYEEHEVLSGNKPLSKSDFLDWELDPDRMDSNLSLGQCEVLGCERYDTERHHWYPEAVAKLTGENADDWPTSLLCHEHHIEKWHKDVNPGEVWPTSAYVQ